MPETESREPAPSTNPIPDPGSGRFLRTLLAKRIGAALLFLVLLAVFQYFASEKARRHNTGQSDAGYNVIFDHDQHPYLSVARKLYDTDFNWVVPRHRMPGYSLLLIPFYDPETAYEIDPTGKDQRRVSEGFFERGKRFNIILCGLSLVGLYFFCRRWMPMLESMIVTWSYGFLLAIFKAPYVQPEGIFYVLFTISFVLLLRQLDRPTWTTGLLAGVALATTFIVKSTVLPLIVLFLTCFVLKTGVDAILERRRGEGPSLKGVVRSLAQAAIVPLIFVTLLSPYLVTTWKLFGSPFWDAHSQYYMWMDSAEEKVKWRDLEISEPQFQPPPGEEPPSSAKYFREHTLEQMIDRPIVGFGKLMPRIRVDYGPLYQFLTEFCYWSVIGVALLHWREVLQALRKHWAVALMSVGFFAGYTLLYSWYVAISVGPRLILGLSLPLTFLALWFISRFSGEVSIPRFGLRIHDRRIVGAILTIAAVLLGWHVLDQDLWEIEGGQ